MTPARIVTKVFLEAFGRVLSCARGVNGRKVFGSLRRRDPSKGGEFPAGRGET